MTAIRRCAGVKLLRSRRLSRGEAAWNSTNASSIRRSSSRPPLAPSSDMRMIVWPIVVLETWDISRADAAADRAAAGLPARAGLFQLELARIRDACCVLAPQGHVRSPRDQAERVRQFVGLHRVPRGRGGLPRCGLGVHRARRDATAARRHSRRGRDGEAMRRRDRGVHRQAAARLGKPRCLAIPRHGRQSDRRRPRICVRLGA